MVRRLGNHYQEGRRGLHRQGSMTDAVTMAGQAGLAACRGRPRVGGRYSAHFGAANRIIGNAGQVVQRRNQNCNHQHDREEASRRVRCGRNRRISGNYAGEPSHAEEWLDDTLEYFKAEAWTWFALD